MSAHATAATVTTIFIVKGIVCEGPDMMAYVCVMLDADATRRLSWSYSNQNHVPLQGSAETSCGGSGHFEARAW